MKIGLVLSKPPSYSETFFNSKIKGLQEVGNCVTLFTGPSADDYYLCKHKKNPEVHSIAWIQTIKMFCVAVMLIPHFRSVWRFLKLEQKEGSTLKRIIEKVYLNYQLLKFKGDLIHFGFATTALQRELVPAAVGAQMIVSLRGYDINVYPLKHPNCYDLLWRQVDKVHAISQYLLKKAYVLGLDESKPFGIIYPAVNLETLPKRDEHGVRNKFKIVTIARFSWIKGLELLTEVALILKNKNLDFEWILIGSGTSTEKERFLFDLNQKQLYEQLFHKGLCSHEETLDILKDSDLYVQTSLNEGFCNAVIEAQALGIPCLAFNVGGLKENIIDKETGWLIEPYDVIAMAKTIIEVSNLTLDEKIKVSEKGIKRVQDYFTLEQQTRAFQTFYVY